MGRERGREGRVRGGSLGVRVSLTMSASEEMTCPSVDRDLWKAVHDESLLN